MLPAIQGITLSSAQVCAALEEWLNRDVLKFPHRIVAISQYDADAEDNRFALTLEPIPPEPDLDIRILSVINPGLPTNGNGNGNHKGEDEYHKELAAVAPAARKRGRSSKYGPEVRQKVLELCNAGIKRSQVARQLGIPESSLYEILAEARQSEDDAAEHAAD